VSSRTYLSIGDVLTLLREEFPDVTISKIRFLESQGLVNPERSPSGYRKFFDHDVERLRWVLRQQREHFLPLKVIRDRLADGELDEAAAEGPNGKPDHAAAQAGALTASEHQPAKADEEAMARILADASRRAARMPEAAKARGGLQVVGEGGGDEKAHMTAEHGHALAAASAVTETSSRDVTTAAIAGGPAPAQSSARRAPAGGAGPGNGTSGPRRPAAPAADARTTSSAAEPATRKSAAPTAGGPAGRATTPDTTGAVVTGASLTADELCAASGLPPEEVAGLEGFGLIEPVVVAGMPTYDEDALTVANLAAAFGAFGIEPRHLRLFRNAVDREMGLIEQVVIPLLRQRNPESRQRALEGADQLAALGQSMRSTLLRLALRRHLGG
jgi:DNA-binding transcriptional MerR regulator